MIRDLARNRGVNRKKGIVVKLSKELSRLTDDICKPAPITCDNFVLTLRHSTVD